MNKTLLVVALLSTLLFTGVAGTQVVNLAKAAYEYLYMGEVPPDADTEPPKIEIFSPENNTSYNMSNINLHLNVSVGDSTTADSRFYGVFSMKQIGSRNVFPFMSVSQRQTCQSSVNSQLQLT